MEPRLPEALMESLDFRDLNDGQVANLKARLRWIRTITADVETFSTKSKNKNDIKAFLEDLELNLSVNQNLPRHAGERDDEQFWSSWLVHSTWKFDCTGVQLTQELSGDLLPFLQGSELPLVFTANEFLDWLLARSKALRTAHDRFYSAPTFVNVLAHMFVIDILLAEMLVGTYKAHFNDLAS